MRRARVLALVLAAALLAACSGGTATSSKPASPLPSAVAGGLTAGLIAFQSAQGIGVLDPNTGKQALVVPVSSPQFRITGPAWGPAARAGTEAIYFTLHDDRPPESSTTEGVVAYDWIFRADPFTGALEPIAAAPDPTSEGPVNLVGGSHGLAYTVGCCGDYRVRRLPPGDPPQPPSALPHLDQAGSIFAEAVSPLTGWLVVKSSGGSWVWYDPETGRTQQLAVELKPDDGPVTISDGDRLAAVSGGKVVVADAKAGGQPRELAAAGPAASSLSWGPSGRLAVVANGGVTVVDTAGEGASPAPATRYLSLAGVSSVSWSAPMPGLTLAAVRKVPAPQQLVDALLTASRLPAAVDSVAGRARTKVYVWRLDLKQAGAQNSAEAKVTKVTPAFLGQHPALPADVLWHHWAATDWLLGGCYRYRVVVSWPSGSVASTIGLGDQAAC